MMIWWHAVLLGIVEGITEFLPVSSTGHLYITQAFLGYDLEGASITAFTAIIQVGAIIAAVVYFARDIARIAVGWVKGLGRDIARLRGTHRKHARPVSAEAEQDYRLGWIVIIGSVPIGIIGFLLRDVLDGLANLWVIAGGLAMWSVVMWWAERRATQERGMESLTTLDAIALGLMQCIALIPGVSRSGATISGGLFRGIDRVTATRVSFYLGIPALVAAGGFQAVTSYADIAGGVGWTATLIATVVSFVVALGAIAWLLRLVAKRSIVVFVWYRLIAAAVIVALLLWTPLTAAGGWAS
jgi:undecaprenyl-diphosphatase